MKKSKLVFILLLLAIFIGAFLRFNNIAKEPFWFDEAWSASSINKSFYNAVFKIPIIYDVHPLFQHFVFYFWGKLGTSELILRSLSAISGILSIIFIYLIGKNLFNEKVGLISAFILALSPEHIRFAQEFRPYAFFTLLTLIAIYFLIRAIKNNKKTDWVFYSIFSILCIYTDHFYLMLFASILIFFTFTYKHYKTRVKNFITSHLAIFLISIPSIVIAFYQFLYVRNFMSELPPLNPFWKILIIPYNFLALFLGTFNPYMQNFILNKDLVLILAFILIVYLILFLKGILSIKQKEKLLFLVLMLLPIFILYAVNFFTYIQMEPKRFLFVAFPLYILVALGISKIKKRYLFLLSAFFILIVSLVSISSYYSQENSKWDELVLYMEKNSKEGDAVVISPPTLRLVFDYYYKGDIPVYGIPLEYVPSEEILNKMPLERYNYSQMVITKDNFKYAFEFTLKDKKRIWFIQSRESVFDKDLLLKEYLDSRYSLIEKNQFIDVTLYLYEAQNEVSIS